MVKKFVKNIITAICVLTVLAVCLPLQAFAAEDNRQIGRIYIYKPSVNVEIYNSEKKVKDCSVMLGDETLDIERSSAYDRDSDKSLIYLLVDLSTSINQKNFDRLKEALCDFVDDMPQQDKLVMTTFGSSITTVLSGSESTSERKSAIRSLKANQNRTTFYEALKDVYNKSLVDNDKFDRRYLIVVSDGIDLQKGSATKDEITSLYKTHALPMFALCDDSNSSATVNELGQLARSSGGNVYLYNYYGAKDAVKNIENTVNNSYIIKANSADNKADGKTHKLSVNLDGKQFTQNVTVMNSVVDKTCPTADISYDKSSPKCFSVTFSEKVLNAEDPASYIITRGGKNCEVASVEAAEGENAYTVYMKNYIKNGDYEFDLSNIKDTSAEHNSAETATVYELKTAYALIIVLYCLAAMAIIAVLVAVIVLVTKNQKKKAAQKAIQSKKSEQIDYVQDNSNVEVMHKVIFNEKSSIDITLELSRVGASNQTVKAKLFESLIVGRADICDICIDDKRMSRQHFVLQNNNGKIIISDLDTTNGTFVNSIKLVSPMILNQGDEIVAGTCRIKFYSGGYSK